MICVTILIIKKTIAKIEKLGLVILLKIRIVL